MNIISSTAKTLIIRADANTRMGTGHVMRCLALGQAWCDAGGDVVFATLCENTFLLQRLRDECFQVVELTDEKAFFSYLSSGLPLHAWVILDGYHFGLETQRAVRTAGCKLLLIDDYSHQSEYECDILVNQNINAHRLTYCINPDARQYLGTDYAMLRREFRFGLREAEKDQSEGRKHLLVTLGGADPDNATLKVIKALSRVHVGVLTAKVVVGPANSHLDSLRQAAASCPAQVELVPPVGNMTSLMQWADAAVSAGGSTCWELCRMGVPFTTLVLAENQRELACELDRMGVASCLGVDGEIHSIAGEIKELLSGLEETEDRVRMGQSLVDGFGVDRILYQPAKDAGVDIFAGRLGLRPAVESDSNLFWEWANDPAVRGNSYHPDPIPLDEHCNWFLEKLSSHKTLMLVLELDGQPVGQIRFDRVDDSAMIGFSVAQKFRGLGLGCRLVRNSLALAIKELSVRVFRAEVFQTNPASNAAFVKTGFELVERNEIKGIPSYVYVREF